MSETQHQHEDDMLSPTGERYIEEPTDGVYDGATRQLNQDEVIPPLGEIYTQEPPQAVQTLPKKRNKVFNLRNLAVLVLLFAMFGIGRVIGTKVNLPAAINPVIIIQNPEKAPEQNPDTVAAELEKRGCNLGLDDCAIQYWSYQKWLTADEALTLPQQENVVNLAYLLNTGKVKYAQDFSVRKEDLQTTKYAVGTVGNAGNKQAVTVIVGDNEFIVNIYQPFVLQSMPGVIYMVDENGIFYSTTLRGGIIKHLAEVQGSLPIRIQPNSKLSQ